jgi:hypothetical protein
MFSRFWSTSSTPSSPPIQLPRLRWIVHKIAAHIGILSLFFFGYIRFLVFLLVIVVSLIVIELDRSDSEVCHEVFCSSDLSTSRLRKSDSPSGSAPAKANGCFFQRLCLR